MIKFCQNRNCAKPFETLAAQQKYCNPDCRPSKVAEQNERDRKAHIEFQKNAIDLIVRLRDKRKISATRLANRIGVTRMTLYRWETHKRMIPLASFIRILEELDVNLFVVYPTTLPYGENEIESL